MIAIDPLRNIYVEEYYDDAFVAQYMIQDGNIIKTVDEDYGNHQIELFDIPENSILPYRPLEHDLNFTGLRYRGMRETEKVAEWVKPLPILEKIPLLKTLNISIPPMMIFGIAESRVLSETALSDTETLVCRRIQLLRALPEVQTDNNGLPYDYDTISFHILHAHNHETEEYLPLHEAIQLFPELKYPMDCIYHEGELIVTESGYANNPATVHIFATITSNR